MSPLRAARSIGSRRGGVKLRAARLGSTGARASPCGQRAGGLQLPGARGEIAKHLALGRITVRRESDT